MIARLTLTRVGVVSGGDLLRCQGLSKSFGDRLAVDDVSFSLAPGEIYGLLGPNGAGKTTTIRMVCGLLTPDQGTITIGGKVATDDLSVRSLVGYVPQDVALYPDLTAARTSRSWAVSTSCAARSSTSGWTRPCRSQTSQTEHATVWTHSRAA